MNRSSHYIFTSDRLGFRQWIDTDIDWYTRMNADPKVMRFFPKVMTREESLASMQKLIKRYHEHGHTFYVSELLEDHTPIGFIGIGYQDFEADFTPIADLGWRLMARYWGHGYATEGAMACVRYAFAHEHLGMSVLHAIAPTSNQPSIHLMQKIGMTQVGTFDHPLLHNYPTLQPCVLYQIKK